MILTDAGLDPRRLSPELAGLLGDGSEIVREAAATTCASVEPVHFLGHLAKKGGSLLRVSLLEPRRVDPERFCRELYDVALDEDRLPGMPTEFGLSAMSGESRQMLEGLSRAVNARSLEKGGLEKGGAEKVGEALFLRVLLDHLPIGRRMLSAVAGSREDYERWYAKLDRIDRTRGAPRPVAAIFDEGGLLRLAAFDRSGRRVIDRLAEEVAALGARRATALHLLYTLVGIQGGCLGRALQFQAVDPVRDVHAVLAGELARPGAGRAALPQLGRESLHGPVARVFELAGAMAERDRVKVGELHIARALAAENSSVAAQWLASRKVNLDALREYLARTEEEEPDAEEARRLPIGEIEKELRDHILGQDDVITHILSWVKRHRYGFPRERGPAAVLLFLGPSGTGKTELAKQLARTVYGSPENLIFLEMGQYATKESVNNFIGAPPGYIGYGEGKLTNGLRDSPECVVLFDEVEKAHKEVYTALLRFLDEGLIDDPAGPTRDGRRCIIVLTVNKDWEKVVAFLPPPGTPGAQTDRKLEEAVRDVMVEYLEKPEIYNRIDDKAVFRPFERGVYRELVRRQVDVEKRKFAERDVAVSVGPDVVEWLCDKAEEQRKEGARCVPRLVNRYVVAPVIDRVTDNEDRPVSKIVVSMRGDGTLAEEV